MLVCNSLPLPREGDAIWAWLTVLFCMLTGVIRVIVLSLSPELKDSVRLLAFLILILSKFGNDCVDGIMLAGFVN